jgi:hypothetical protein
MSCLMEASVVTSRRPLTPPTGLKTDILQYLGPLPSSDVIPMIPVVVKQGYVVIRNADDTREGTEYIGISSCPSVTG